MYLKPKLYNSGGPVRVPVLSKTSIRRMTEIDDVPASLHPKLKFKACGQTYMKKKRDGGTMSQHYRARRERYQG